MAGISAPMIEQAVFVYGKFVSSSMAALLTEIVRTQANLSPEPPVSIEILREFGPQEFIGKVYVLRETAWRPVTPEGAASFDWYQTFQKGEPVYFDMRGSGRWEIEWFRFESSARTPNPYLAVALRQKSAAVSQQPSAIPGT